MNHMKVEFLPVFIRWDLFSGILTPIDEFQYWADISESAEKKSVKERAAYFTELFKPLQKVSMCPVDQSVLYEFGGKILSFTIFQTNLL